MGTCALGEPPGPASRPEEGHIPDESAQAQELAEGDNDGDLAYDDSGDRPKGWASWSTTQLTKLLVKAKGAASEAVIGFVKKHLKGTKLIFVVGQTGTGKSSLLREITGMDLKVGATVRSGTLNYQVCPAIIEGEQYLFIDTAGFGASDLNGLENFGDIISCIDALGPFVTVAGVLFVYGGGQARLTNDDLMTIQWVKCFCGPEFYKAITIVTTKWDNTNKDGFEDRLYSVQSLVDQDVITEITNPTHPTGRYEGGTFYHHGLPGGHVDSESFPKILSARTDGDKRAKEIRDLIHRRYAEPTTAKLQVMCEMADGINSRDTQAARVLANHPSSFRLSINAGRVIVNPLVVEPVAVEPVTVEPTAAEPVVVEHVVEPVIVKSKSQASVEEAPDEETRTPASTSQLPKPESGSNSEEGGKNLKEIENEEKRRAFPDKNRNHVPDGRSWFERLVFWLYVGKQAAMYFNEVKQVAAKAEATGEAQEMPTWNATEEGQDTSPTWTPWRALMDWWSGSS